MRLQSLFILLSFSFSCIGQSYDHKVRAMVNYSIRTEELLHDTCFSPADITSEILSLRVWISRRGYDKEYTTKGPCLIPEMISDMRKQRAGETIGITAVVRDKLGNSSVVEMIFRIAS